MGKWWKQFQSAEAEALLHEKDTKVLSFKEKYPDVWEHVWSVKTEREEEILREWLGYMSYELKTEKGGMHHASLEK